MWVASLRWYVTWFDVTGHTGISVTNGQLLVNRYDPGPSPLISRGWRFGQTDAPPAHGWLLVWGRTGTAGNPSFVSLPLWMPLALLLVSTASVWWLDRRRIPPGHCQHCGYDLTGNVSGRCPECGTLIEREGKPA